MGTGYQFDGLVVISPLAHLTNRSSRDRFAARLTRYRVPHRQADMRSGMPQGLDVIGTAFRRACLQTTYRFHNLSMKHQLADFLNREGNYWTVVPN